MIGLAMVAPHVPLPAPDAEGWLRMELAIVNQRGLHARASAKFASLAEAYPAEIIVSRAGESVNGRSIMGLLMLGAGLGSSIHVAVRGAQAEEALVALVELVASKFGEEA